MFSGMKMEEFIKSELSGIFRELFTKNVAPGSSGTHFMPTTVKGENLTTDK